MLARWSVEVVSLHPTVTVEGIIPPSVWDELPVDSIDLSPGALGSMEDSSLWSPFVIRRLKVLPMATAARETTLKMLLFFTYLLRFGTLKKGIRKDPGATRLLSLR